MERATNSSGWWVRILRHNRYTLVAFRKEDEVCARAWDSRLNADETIWENNLKINRTHDAFYKRQGPLEEPKQTFLKAREFISQVRAAYQAKENLKVLDVGCAIGDFPNYLSRETGLDVIGLEFLDELVEESQIVFPTIKVMQGSVLDRDCFSQGYFDVITMLGVLSIFDDPRPALSNLVHWGKKGGALIIHGMFNPDPYDVYIKYQGFQSHDSELEAGWNILSQDRMRQILLDLGVSKVSFHRFKFDGTLTRNESDPVRSWTEQLANGENQIVNGLCIKQPQFFVVIEL